MPAPAPLALPSRIVQHLAADAAASALALADFVAETLRAALRERARATLLVSGGRSPIAFFAALSRRELDWSRVIISLVDERAVPRTHADSNARLLAEHLLQNAAAAAQFVPLYVEAGDIEEAASDAAARIAALPTPFDVVVLGMGDDGHTASLFPGAPGTDAGLDRAQTHRVVVTRPPAAPHARLTLTRRALLDSRTLILAIHGERKRAVLEAAATASPEQLPIAAFVQQDAVPLQLFYSQ
ncbi:6-phosphogluconolactonase [Solimonas soli]|uniref:6-phosphogluconolactonase n=1 Tax=Solimonas soli TaxID=413479 RepID=UPI000480F955|nr:6-phosphogluconolactonase [Solimonas soli]